MPKPRTSRGVNLLQNLPQLQNLIKRDPASYQSEFLNQYNHYVSLLRILQQSPLAFSNSNSEFDAAGASSSSGGNNTTAGQTFRELVTFVAQVAQCYPEETKTFPQELSALILEDGRGAKGLGNDTRKTIVQNLVMLRNKDVISSIELLQTLFPLLPMTTSPTLRSFIRRQILTDIKTANTPSKNHKLNRVVQTLLFGMVEKGMGADVVGNKGRFGSKQFTAAQTKGGEALWAVTLIKELWKKTIWNDAKTVSIVVRACQHPNVKVQSAAVHFFLGDDDEGAEESESEDEGPDLKRLEHQSTIKKKKKGDRNRMARATATVSKKKKDKAAGLNNKVNFPALELLHDAQRFGEDLYENMQKHDKIYTLEHKITIMQLLSRVMGAHKLCILGFYTYIIKYLTYHQLQVTQILVSLAQSVHDLTPPDVLVPIVHKLAHEFVHPGVGAEVIAAGINSIREVSRRQPWVMEGEEDLLSDLIEYRKSKDKGVTTAARGLLQLFREVNPGLLKRRERGKAAALGLLDGQAPAYGHAQEAAEGIDGLDLLDEHFAQARAEEGLDPDAPLNEEEQEARDAEAWQKWEEDEDESDADSDSSGWIEVSSDEENEIEFSDSDDDEEDKAKRTKRGKKGGKKDVDADVDVQEKVEDVEMDDTKSVVSEAAPSVAGTEAEMKKISLLAQQKILTPADFAMLTELRLKAAAKAVEAGGGTAVKRKLAELTAEKRNNNNNKATLDDGFVNEGDILGPRKKGKMDYEERMASIQKGREGRDKFGSKKGKKDKAAPSSSTNREKARNKPIMMAIHSNKVMQKKKASLRDVQMKLRAAAEKQKKSKR